MSDDDYPDALYDDNYTASTVMRAYAAGKKKERERFRALLDDALKCVSCGENLEWSDNAGAYLCEDWDGCEGSCSPERMMERLQELRRRLDEDGDTGE